MMYLMNVLSGTSMGPQSSHMPMLMPRAGSWNFMVMGQAFVVDTQESGPRGADKFYSVNWAMGSAEHALWGGSFMIETMLSLEPATVTERRYPELFQTGETAFGRPLIDAQHPHDFIMGLGLDYAHPAGEHTMLHLYYAPVGDPALGPVAFPHRASAAELPQAPLGHHWEDSTHIASNVATAAVMCRRLRLEASGFRGREPDENRWNIDWGTMDSWSARLSVFPARNWMAQISAGRLASPEGPGTGDVVRATASLHYTRPLADGAAWSTSLIWGRNHEIPVRRNSNAWLAETVYPVSRRNFVTGRVELVDKDELLASGETVGVLGHQPPAPAAPLRVQAYTAGYTRDLGISKNVETGIGANVTAYAVPQTLQASYGDHPAGVDVFLRFRLTRGR